MIPNTTQVRVSMINGWLVGVNCMIDDRVMLPASLDGCVNGWMMPFGAVTQTADSGMIV